MTSPEDKVAILDLYARYNRAIDTGDVDDWCGTFVSDGRFEHPARPWQGAAELREFVVTRTLGFEKAPLRAMRHWNDTILVEVEGESARASCDLIVSGISRTTGTPAVAATGRYEDRLVRTTDGWRFAERRLVLA